MSSWVERIDTSVPACRSDRHMSPISRRPADRKAHANDRQCRATHDTFGPLRTLGLDAAPQCGFSEADMTSDYQEVLLTLSEEGEFHARA